MTEDKNEEKINLDNDDGFGDFDTYEDPKNVAFPLFINPDNAGNIKQA